VVDARRGSLGAGLSDGDEVPEHILKGEGGMTAEVKREQ
jgi:hypothetical protein